MASTTAIRRQSEAIRESMREIRSELPYDVDEARERVKQLSDWRYHLSRRPLAVMGAAAVVGYMMIPAKRTAGTVMVHRDSAPVAVGPTKRGMFGGIAGAVATMALRHAAVMATNQVASKLSQSNSRP